MQKNAPSYDGAWLDTVAPRKKDFHKRFDVLIGLTTDEKMRPKAIAAEERLKLLAPALTFFGELPTAGRSQDDQVSLPRFQVKKRVKTETLAGEGHLSLIPDYQRQDFMSGQK